MKKLTRVIFLLLLTGIILYVGLMQNDKNKILIESIKIYGNNHLSKEDYMSFTNLIDKNSYRNLSLMIIKDRIEKHPYVNYADVRYEGSGKVTIRIYEKNFSSILIDNQNQFLLTEDLELLPFLPNTKNVDYPIISNIFKKDSLRIIKSVKNNYDLLTASKILSSIKFLNMELYNELSVIDMNQGADVLLYFSSLDYPVLLGRGNEIKKIVYFNTLWNYLKGKEINNYMNYIDLRYNEHIYFGIQDSLQAGEKKL